jgi:hypothetical protein
MTVSTPLRRLQRLKNVPFVAAKNTGPYFNVIRVLYTNNYRPYPEVEHAVELLRHPAKCCPFATYDTGV